MIPKIIHYCWLSDDPVPNDFQRYMASWKEKMPDYEYVKWDFNRFDIKSSKWVKEAFENKKYAFAADYIRLYALYNYGGFYLDMDVEVLKSFDKLLCLSTAIGWQKDQEGLEVAAFGVEKGNRWVGECLEYYVNRNFVKDDGSYENKPLPMVVNDILIKKGYNLITVENVVGAKKIEKRNNTIPVFSDYVFSPKSYITGKIHIDDNTYSIHHFASTWVPKRIKLIQYIIKMTRRIGVQNTGVSKHIIKLLKK